ncbi:MAG: DMT family transporter [Rhodovarius sp.]|nr:DMT family transporter [Rhodovarius sp.]MDW8314195.1 DMT family transporter [Rhodovarius sp.]
MILAYAQLAGSMMLVGANVAVAKLLSEALPIALIAHLRCVIAFLVLLPLAAALEGLRLPPPRLLANLFWQAVFGTALYNAGLLAGLRFTSALEGGLVLASLPAVVALGSFLWLRERLMPRQWLAAGLAGLAMAALTLARLRGEEAGAGSAIGNLLVFAGVIGEAVYVLLAKRMAGRVGIFTASLWMQGFSALVLFPFALPGFGAAAALAEPRLAALLLFHALTASVLCLLLWYRGLARVPAGTAGVFTAFLPATAALVAVAFLGEAFGALHGLGLAVMLASVLLASWPRRATQPRSG